MFLSVLTFFGCDCYSTKYKPSVNVLSQLEPTMAKMSEKDKSRFFATLTDLSSTMGPAKLMTEINEVNNKIYNPKIPYDSKVPFSYS